MPKLKVKRVALKPVASVMQLSNDMITIKVKSPDHRGNNGKIDAQKVADAVLNGLKTSPVRVDFKFTSAAEQITVGKKLRSVLEANIQKIDPKQLVVSDGNFEKSAIRLRDFILKGL